MDRTTAYTDQERSLDACMLDATQFLDQDDSGVALNISKVNLFGFDVLQNNDMSEYSATMVDRWLKCHKSLP